LIAITAALPVSNLGGLTLLSAVYAFPTLGVDLPGTLTLDAAGDSTRQLIFKIDTTFTAELRIHWCGCADAGKYAHKILRLQRAIRRAMQQEIKALGVL
jgi:hypothetical protein